MKLNLKSSILLVMFLTFSFTEAKRTHKRGLFLDGVLNSLNIVEGFLSDRIPGAVSHGSSAAHIATNIDTVKSIEYKVGSKNRLRECALKGYVGVFEDYLEENKNKEDELDAKGEKETKGITIPAVCKELLNKIKSSKKSKDDFEKMYLDSLKNEKKFKEDDVSLEAALNDMRSLVGYSLSKSYSEDVEEFEKELEDNDCSKFKKSIFKDFNIFKLLKGLWEIVKFYGTCNKNELIMSITVAVIQALLSIFLGLVTGGIFTLAITIVNAIKVTITLVQAIFHFINKNYSSFSFQLGVLISRAISLGFAIAGISIRKRKLRKN